MCCVAITREFDPDGPVLLFSPAGSSGEPHACGRWCRAALAGMPTPREISLKTYGGNRRDTPCKHDSITSTLPQLHCGSEVVEGVLRQATPI